MVLNNLEHAFWLFNHRSGQEAVSSISVNFVLSQWFHYTEIRIDFLIRSIGKDLGKTTEAHFVLIKLIIE
jgi:hypothetical protein